MICRYQSYTKVEAVFDRLTPSNASKLVARHDIVVDATDNVGTR